MASIAAWSQSTSGSRSTVPGATTAIVPGGGAMCCPGGGSSTRVLPSKRRQFQLLDRHVHVAQRQPHHPRIRHFPIEDMFSACCGPCQRMISRPSSCTVTFAWSPFSFHAGLERVQVSVDKLSLGSWWDSPCPSDRQRRVSPPDPTRTLRDPCDPRLSIVFPYPAGSKKPIVFYLPLRVRVQFPA